MASMFQWWLGFYFLFIKSEEKKFLHAEKINWQFFLKAKKNLFFKNNKKLYITTLYLVPQAF